MKKKSTLIFEAIGLTLVSFIAGICIIAFGAYMGGSFEGVYSKNYMEVPAWAEIVPIIICVFGIIFIIMQIVNVIKYIAGWSGQIIEDNGKIVEILERKKHYTKVLVEFGNGQRVNLYTTNSKMIVTQGDSGFIGAQGKYLVYIKK